LSSIAAALQAERHPRRRVGSAPCQPANFVIHINDFEKGNWNRSRTKAPNLQRIGGAIVAAMGIGLTAILARISFLACRVSGLPARYDPKTAVTGIALGCARMEAPPKRAEPVSTRPSRRVAQGLARAALKEGGPMNAMPDSFLSGARKRLRDASPLWAFYAMTVLLAFGFAMFNLTLAGDDWPALQSSFQTDLVISVGRWMDAIIWWLANSDNFAPPLTFAVLAGAYLVFAAACCLCLGLDRPGSYLIFACILVCVPINAEPFSFKNMHLNFSFAILLAAICGILIVRGYEWLAEGRYGRAAALGTAAAAAFVLSAAAYQTLALLAVALVSTRVVGLLREPCESANLLRKIAILLGFCALVVAVGYLLYLESIRLASWLTRVPLNASGPYAIVGSFVDSWGELRLQIAAGIRVWGELLFHSQHLFPKVAKLVFLIMTVALVIAVAFRPGAPDRPGAKTAADRISRAAVLLGVMVLLFVTPLALGMVRKVSGYRYNNLIGIDVAYAMVFALLFELATDIRWRRGLAVVTLAVLAIFIFEQNRASVTMFLLNRRDLAIAGSMLDRITADPAFAPYAAKGQAVIEFYGEPFEVLPRPFSADEYLLGAIDSCGVFNCQIGRATQAFRLISTNNMRYRTTAWPDLPTNITAEERQLLEQRIKAAHPWPAPDAVIFGTNVIVVKLSDG
jgi:hypothetical protein